MEEIRCKANVILYIEYERYTYDIGVMRTTNVLKIKLPNDSSEI